MWSGDGREGHRGVCVVVWVSNPMAWQAPRRQGPNQGRRGREKRAPKHNIKNASAVLIDDLASLISPVGKTPSSYSTNARTCKSTAPQLQEIRCCFFHDDQPPPPSPSNWNETSEITTTPDTSQESLVADERPLIRPAPPHPPQVQARSRAKAQKCVRSNATAAHPQQKTEPHRQAHTHFAARLD